MTFEEAREAFKQMAADRYRCMYYTLDERQDGQLVARCRLYASDGISTMERPTWQECLNEMRVLLGLAEAAPVVLEAPQNG